VAVSYLVLYGALLVATRGLPYVCDNNESFCSFCHAYNLYHFDFSRSCGLTDEACSPHAEAHPYVHTHQGNFPRLYSFLIYVLGARGIESQIVITTFTIGLLALFFAYHFFARLVTPLFGLVTCLLLMTDYVMFAQWQVNTYRVWHGFFVFSSLLCVQGLGGARPRIWRWLTLLNFLGLFYYELVFVFFVCVTSLLYALYLYRRTPRVVLAGLLWGGAGGVLALGILFVQLTAYMGVKNVLQDARLTIHSRQFTPTDRPASEELLAFYRQHHIAFFPNFVDGRTLLNARAFLLSLSRYHLLPYTPILSVVLLTVFLGWFQGVLWKRQDGRQGGVWERVHGFALVRWIMTACKAIVLSACGAKLFLALAPAWLPRLSSLGLPTGVRSLTGAAVMGGAGLSLVVTWLATHRWWGFGRMSAVRVASAGLALLALAWVIRHQDELFDPNYAPIWLTMTRRWYVQALAHLSLLTAAGMMAVLVIEPTRLLERKTLAGLGRLLPVLLCGLAGYGAAYRLASGYVYSGYSSRWLSFLVFFTIPALASGAYVVLLVLLRGVRLLRQPWQITAHGGSVISPRTQPLPRLAGVALPTLSTAVLFFWATGFWIALQSLYVVLMPPDHFDVLRLLREPPFAGASFASSAYALPIGMSTGEWAVLDPELYTGRIQFGAGEYVVARDKTFLWLADRERNAAYEKPDYYLIFNYQAVYSVSAKLARRHGRDVPQPGPPKDLIGRPSPDRPAVLNHRIVAADPTGRERWAIVKLDWDFPPTLAPLPGKDPAERVRLEVEAGTEGWIVTVNYRYAHQEGKLEAGSLVELHGLDESCTVQREQVQRGRAVFRLPRSWTGNLRASVIPRTATRSGTVYWSNCVNVGVGSVRGCTLRGSGSVSP
jgi:hypothetical protein